MCLNIKTLIKIFEICLIPIAFFLAPMMYLFGGLEAIIYKNQEIYKDLITSSFTLAGFTTAAIAFVIKQEKKIIKFLIPPTALFLLSGLLMYANIIVGEFSTFNIDTAKSNILNYGFSAYVLIGGVGIILFFETIVLLITELIKISYYCNSEKSEK
jgi:hypothetical protein